MNKILILLLLTVLGCGHNSHHHKKNHNFKDAEFWSKKFDAPDRVEYQKPKELIKLMNIKNSDHIADIGAGTGYMLPYFNSVVTKGLVFGLDVEKELVVFMRNRIKNEKLTQARAELIAFSDPQLRGMAITKVFILNTWHHIENHKDYAKKIYDQTPSHTELFLVEPEPNKGGPGPKHRMLVDSVMTPLKAAKFKCELLKESLPYQYVIKCWK